MTKIDEARIAIMKTVRDSNPDSYVYVLPNLFTKKMKSFMLIREDLNLLIEVTNRLIYFQNQEPADDILSFALWQSIIVTYGKCFTENNAGLSKLEKKFLDESDPKLQQLHEKLMDLRHSYIAHRDETEKEQALVFLKISKEKEIGEDAEYLIKSRKLVKPKSDEVIGYLALFETLKAIVEEKIQKNGEKAHKAFLENLSPEQVNLLLLNNMKD